MQEESTQKVVMFLGGGAMAGVFGGGVLSGLNEISFQKNIRAIYAVSAGALNGAYFLTGETEKGASIYLENLPGKFVHLWRIPGGILQLLWNRYIKRLNPNGKIFNVIDIDYLFSVVKEKKPLNTALLQANGKNFHVKLLNIETGNCEYINIAEGDPLTILKAAVNVKPYYFPFQLINNRKYIDGGIKEQFGIDYLREKYPEDKIIAIFNEPITWRIKYYIKNFLEGLISSLYPYSAPLFKFFRNRESLLRNDLKKALKDPKVLVVYCPNRNGILQVARKPNKLLKHYQLGKEAAQKVIEFLED